MEENKVYWVRGNTQTLLIPLEKEVMTPQEEIEVEPYYPEEGSEIVVRLVGQYNKYSYTPQVDGNLLLITDNGGIGRGCYSVEILVTNPDGTHDRSMWENQVVVTDSNASVLQEWDEFKKQNVKARAALFFFAKGDKGDPFTYDDFTPEQIEELQRPATEAAERIDEKQTEINEAELKRQEAEDKRDSAERQRETKELERQEAEQTRDNKESARQEAEQTRSQNEVQRQRNEQSRQEDYNRLHQNVLDSIEATEKATDDAIKAKEDCEEWLAQQPTDTVITDIGDL